MKIILDESVPQKLRLLIQGHSVVTAWYQGWSGLKNGELLAAAEEAGFDLFITADQEISYQQNLAGRKMALLVLSTNNWDHIKSGDRQDNGGDRCPDARQLRRGRDLAGEMLPPGCDGRHSFSLRSFAARELPSRDSTVGGALP